MYFIYKNTENELGKNDVGKLNIILYVSFRMEVVPVEFLR